MSREQGIVEVVTGSDKDKESPTLEAMLDGFSKGKENEGSEKEDEYCSY